MKTLITTIFCVIALTLSNLDVYSQDKPTLKKDTVDWNKFINERLDKYEREGLDTLSKNGIIGINNFAWYTVFYKSSDKKQLVRTGKLMEVVVNLKSHPRFPEMRPMFMDTYANLLYKVGKVKQAIAVEENAIKLADENFSKHPENVSPVPEFQKVLKKFKSGEKTWISEKK